MKLSLRLLKFFHWLLFSCFTIIACKWYRKNPQVRSKLEFFGVLRFVAVFSVKNWNQINILPFRGAIFGIVYHPFCASHMEFCRETILQLQVYKFLSYFAK